LAGKTAWALHTPRVDDLDAFSAGLAARGIESGPAETVGHSVHHAIVANPDGNPLNIGSP
jgi:hypothetical protein